MTCVVGVDPGVTGAIAWINGDEYGVVDMPSEVVDGTYRRKILADEVADIFHERKPDLVVVEEVGPIGEFRSETRKGRVSPSSNFRLGQSHGIILGIVAAIRPRARVERVKPADWKVLFGLGRDKEMSRAAAKRLFPLAGDRLNAKKDHNRAEALLLAYWGTAVK